MNDRFLTARDVADLLALNVASVWRLVQAGNFPLPIYVAPRAARWRLSEIEAVLESRRMRPAEAAARRRAARVAAE
ncbi:helix-turn-helix transcriptional regulator [Elioraea tepidiphila]|jgi:predicted DNA-binding transcriptional regulator AlpA|uniref:helix-turn-helix transcriptional regulator n=1 Tax=Elioraea tepidiphila TaxID=457934 RepID=UPI00036D19FD|nr:AlpA family phage regulatory protein [Elioraea tepidiphila]